jgi:hypothetical protein
MRNLKRLPERRNFPLQTKQLHGDRGSKSWLFPTVPDRDQNIELGCSTSQQLAVLDAGPAELGNGLDLVAGKVVAQRARDALVKQHSHRQSDGLWPVRARQSPCRG